jgi:4-hydroxy-tetrahydrodipicolinate reductase
MRETGLENRRYRVAQWGTGNVGLYALRAIIQHPRMDLVGCWVHSDAKARRDAGELCGLPPAGVIATQSIDDIISARPDCVVYMPHESDFEALARLLGAGINVSTSLLGFHSRSYMDQGIREKLEDACKKGEASIYASGSTPGWFTEIMPLALSGLERRLDCITLSDFADMASRNSPEMLFEVLPFGKRPEDVPESGPVGTAISSPPSFTMTAAALGLPLDEIVTGRDFALAKQRTTVAAGTIEAGTIAALRMSITGLRGGKPVIRRNSVWYLTKDIDQPWDLRDTGLHYSVEGDLPLDVMIRFPVSEEDYPKISPAMTANPVLNAVPYVCEAPPGILQTDDLPPIIGKFA